MRSLGTTVLAYAALAACLAVTVAPIQAQALEVEKLTCRPNGDSGSDVLGGTETRITWEVQADVDEALKAFPSPCPRAPLATPLRTCV